MERLEGRTLLSGDGYTFTWTGTANNGLWDDYRNWANTSGNPIAILIPGIYDDVVINPNSGTIKLGIDAANNVICGAGTTLIADGGSLLVDGGMTQDGTLDIDGGATLYFAGNQTLDGSGSVVFGPSGENAVGTTISNVIKVASTNTLSTNPSGSNAPGMLVIGPQMTISGESGEIGGDQLINQGTITTDGDITIGSNDNTLGKGLSGGYFLTSFDNQGTVEATNGGIVAFAATSQTIEGKLNAHGGTILLENPLDTLPLSPLTVNNNATFTADDGGVIDLATTITNGGRSLTLDDAGGSFVALTYSTVVGRGQEMSTQGTVNGGTIVAASDGSGISASLDDVTLSGNFDEKNGGFIVRDGLNIFGTLTIESSAGLTFINTQEFGGIGHVNLGSKGASSPAVISFYSDPTSDGIPGATTLTLGPGLTMAGPNCQITAGSSQPLAGAATLISYATFPNVEHFDIALDNFVNLGNVECTGVGEIRSGTFNSGYLGVTGGGALTIFGLTNAGTVALDSGRLIVSSIDQTASGILDLALDGTAAGKAYGQVTILGYGPGPLAIGGTLNIDVGADFKPGNGAHFNVVTYKPSTYYFKLATKRGHMLSLWSKETGLALPGGGQLKGSLTTKAFILTASVPKGSHKPPPKAGSHKRG